MTAQTVASAHAHRPGGRGVTPDTALGLARYFGASVGFWINRRAQYDAGIAKIEDADIAASIVPFDRAAA